MIRLFSVSKRYCERVWALRDVSFDICEGDSLLIRGESGSGKTTLLRLLYGDETPDEGQIVVAGRNILKLRSSSLPYFRRQVGFVFQGLDLMEERTVLENVSFPLHLQGIWGRKARKRAEKACALAGLEDGLGRRCRELARGEQQLACLARAIVAEPSLLLADEPTAHLDAKRTLHVLNLLARVNARGTTVVLASGDLMVAGAFPTHREIQLRGGRLVGDGPSESERQTGLPKPARADALCEVTSSGQCAKQRSRSGTSAGGDEISKAVEHGKGA